MVHRGYQRTWSGATVFDQATMITMKQYVIWCAKFALIQCVKIKLLLNISTNSMKSIITVTAITVKNFSVKQLVRTTFATSHK